jgi:hypothetical protein
MAVKVDARESDTRERVGSGGGVSKTARFSQAEIKRTIAGVMAAGLPVAGVDVNDNGFVVLVGEPGTRKRRNMADELYGPQA